MYCPSLNDLPASPDGKKGWPWTEESCRMPAILPDGSLWPCISIVTPSFNQSIFIEETIRSVLLQGYPQLEYIVIDGGSTDGSVEIIRKYTPWLSYWISEPDGGQSAAIGKGFARCNGEIIAWLNSDDCYQPNTLLRVANFFKKKARVVIGNGDVYTCNEQSEIICRWFASQAYRFLAANIGINHWTQPACFWLRSAYERVGGMDDSMQFCMDFDLCLRLTKIGTSRRIPGPPLAKFRRHTTSKTATLQHIKQQELEQILKRDGMGHREKWLPLLLWLWRLSEIPTSFRVRMFYQFGLESFEFWPTSIMLAKYYSRKIFSKLR